MPVYKYKSFEDAQKALWCFKTDSNYYKQLSELWNTADMLTPVNCQRGVFKFKNIVNANKHRTKWELDMLKYDLTGVDEDRLD